MFSIRSNSRVTTMKILKNNPERISKIKLYKLVKLERNKFSYRNQGLEKISFK